MIGVMERRIRYVGTALGVAACLHRLLWPTWRVELPSGNIWTPASWLLAPPPGDSSVAYGDRSIDWVATLPGAFGLLCGTALWWWISGALIKRREASRVVDAVDATTSAVPPVDGST